MKPLKSLILLVTCLCGLSPVLQAQGGNKVPQEKQLTTTGWEFAPVGAKWYYEYDDRTNLPNVSFAVFECVKDTTIEGFVLRRIDCIYLESHSDPSDWDIDGPWPGKFHKRNSFYVCSREDTAYVYDLKKKALARMFVFNAKPGDVLTLDVHGYIIENQDYKGDTYRIRVDEVITEEISGVSVKKYRTTPLDEIYLYRYADYGGNLSSFFPLGAGPYATGSNATAGPLRCYYDPNQDVTIKFIEDCECDAHPMIIIDGIEGTEADSNGIQVFYSPDERQLWVQSATGAGECRTALFTDEGTKVLEFAGEKADLSELSAGIYLVQVESLKGNTVLFKGKIQVK